MTSIRLILFLSFSSNSLFISPFLSLSPHLNMRKTPSIDSPKEFILVKSYRHESRELLIVIVPPKGNFKEKSII